MTATWSSAYKCDYLAVGIKTQLQPSDTITQHAITDRIIVVLQTQLKPERMRITVTTNNASYVKIQTRTTKQSSGSQCHSLQGSTEHFRNILTANKITYWFLREGYLEQNHLLVFERRILRTKSPTGF